MFGESIRFRVWAVSALLMALATAATAARAESPTSDVARAAMKRAATYYRTRVAAHGGYVYHYTVDLTRRWGEGAATADQIWVQAPGTPTVGLAYLAAWRATGDKFYLEAATESARALIYGQLRSGGWTNVIDFDPQGKQVAAYRNGKGQGKSNSTLDDGITQGALTLLMRVDQALEFNDREIHGAVKFALDALLAAQFPNGGFPQVWTGPSEPRPVVKARYPNYDWRTENRVKAYWTMYTLNDDLAGHTADMLLTAHEIYRDERALTALRKLGDFLLLAQMPEPQPAWAQQYDTEMRPIWARKFEPPAISGRESQDAVATLLKISHIAQERKYLEPIPRALAYLKKSRLSDGRLARFYELQTNRPLYMTTEYKLTHDDSQVPTHYGWKTESQLERLESEYQATVEGRDVVSAQSQAPDVGGERAAETIRSLDGEGRWVETHDGKPLVGQPKIPLGAQYLSSEVFSRKLTLLSEYVEQLKPQAK